MDEEEYAKVLAPTDPDKPAKKLTQEQRMEWNKFINFLDKEGYKGNPELDKGEDVLGRELFNKYKKANPAFDLQYEDVPVVQSELKEIAKLYAELKGTSKAKVTSGDDKFIETLSPVDGRIGSKTSNSYFPTASTTDPKGKVVKNYGTDIEAYYQDLINKK